MSTTLLRRSLATAVALVAFVLAGPAAASSEQQLLRTYQPVTTFDPQERFLPGRVRSFVAGSILEELVEGSWVAADGDPQSQTLPTEAGRTFRLNRQPCTPASALGGLDCYTDAASGSRSGPTYARVIAAGGRTVLQYWYFYEDNTYSYAYPPSDLLWQAHEGDWEVVNVVLDRNGRPELAGYSQHCLGQTRPWDQVERRDGTHPVVYVGVGSHANYFAPGRHPFDVRCVPIQAIALLGQLGLPLPADVAGLGAVAGPEGAGTITTRIRVLDESSSRWLGFRGFWGELQYLHAPVIGTVPFGTAPVGPSLHSVWGDPLETMAGWNG